MSNGLAVAAVTSTLRFVLDRALQQAHPGPVGGARTTTLRPDQLNGPDLANDPCLNLFLYRVSPNHTWNQENLPTRRSDGSLANRAATALDLHYLITCHGHDESLDPQRLLGTAVIAFSQTPVMTGDVVRQAMAAYSAEPQTTFLAEADLADQVEVVRISPQVLSLEELSKVWSIMLQTPYQLSLTYTATAALLQADVTPKAVLPVRSRSLVVSSSGPVRLESIGTDPLGGVAGPGDQMVLTGSNLLASAALSSGGGAPITVVQVGPAWLIPAEGSSSQQLRVMLDDTVPAGVHSVRVVHESASVSGGQPARGLAASGSLPLLIRPAVTVQSTDPAQVTLMVSPPLFAGQRGSLTLQALPGSDSSSTVSLDLAVVPAGGAPQPLVEVPRAGIPDGAWLLTVQVDGVESLPELVGGVYGAPELTLP